MIISNSRKFIFFHIPKSGGTSVAKLLDGDLRWNDVLLGGTPTGEIFSDCWSPRFKMYKHSLPQEVRAAIGDEVYYGYRKFVVVRDPIERIRSAYKYIKTLIKNDAKWFTDSDEYAKIDEIDTFEGFLSSKYYRAAIDADPLNSQDIQRCLMPQAMYVDIDELKASGFAFYKLQELAVSCERLVMDGFLCSLKTLGRENPSDEFCADITENTLSNLKEIYSDDYRIFGF